MKCKFGTKNSPKKSKEYVTKYSIKKNLNLHKIWHQKRKRVREGRWRGGWIWNGYVERSSRATMNKK
jgi:hypothetical protein